MKGRRPRRLASPRAVGAARPRVLPLLTALLLFATAGDLAAQVDRSGVQGVVLSEASGRPLANAMVEVFRADWSGGAVTDRWGRYQVDGVPAGRNTVRVRHIGHASFELEIVVAPGRSVPLDVTLPVQPVALAPVEVEAAAAGTATTSSGAAERELAAAGVRTIEASPALAELGIGDAIRDVPDPEQPDAGGILYVRGGGADLKLVYLDGAPVYAPFPLGGLMEPFTPGLLHRADVYLGGAPARYDGGLSYVMDLRTRGGGGSGLSFSGSADLLSARGLIEAPLGDRVGVVASARGMHPLISPHLFQDALPYGYGEGVVRADARIGDSGALTVTGFRNEEAVRLGSAMASDSTIRWGNTAVSMRLSGHLGASRVELTASRGDYAAHLPLGGVRRLIADAGSRRSRIALDVGRTVDAFQLRYGASLDQQEHEATARSAESGARTGAAQGSGSVLGVYGEAAGQLTERIRVRGGLRLDSFSGGGPLAVAPRAAATVMVTERAALTIAAGRYHQFLRPPDEVLLNTGDPLLLTGGSSLVVGSASHVTLGLDQDLGDEVRLGLEGYYKNFTDVPGSYGTSANASGFDLWVRRGGEGWTGWLGYSLAWYWSPARAARPAEFAGRHLLSLGLGAPLTQTTTIDVRFAYGAGLPYAAIPVGPQSEHSPVNGWQNSVPLQAAERGGTESAPLLHLPDHPYLRLDASLSRPFTHRRGDRVFEITPYVRVLNGLGQRDALFYLMEDRSEGTTRAIGSMPLIPIVGFQWKL